MLTTASLLTDFWQDQLVEHDRQFVFLVLLGILGSFGFIRMSTRLMRSPRVPWWPGSVVSDGGLHVHHLVFGIVLMMIAGAVGFAVSESDWAYGACALGFGIGVGLTIDEFALWVYLDDVYWKEEGRASVDAAVLAVTGLALVLLGVRPFELQSDSVEAVVGSSITLVFNVAMATICLLKQRLWHGTVGLFFPPLAIYGAARLGKPGSAWARRRYGSRNPAKQERAERRFPPDRRTERFKRVFRDAVGGSPEDEYEAKIQRR